jgi:hypothetical protein
MTNDTPDPQDTDGIAERDRRALTECMTVLPEGGDMYTVVGENDSTYQVDTRGGRCTCPDHEHRDVHCKHIRRATFATGQRPIPPQIDRDAVDDLLGEHCEGPYYTRAGTASSTDAVADGSGASPVDPDGPETEPYSDDNYDDRFGAEGER